MPTKFCSLCLRPNQIQLDLLMEGLRAMSISSCTPDNGSVLHFQEMQLMLGVNKVLGLKLFLYKFCGPRLSASIHCSAPHNMFTIALCLEFCCLRCSVAEMGGDVINMGQEYAPLYRFVCYRFPKAISCHRRITPTQGMNSR